MKKQGVRRSRHPLLREHLMLLKRRLRVLPFVVGYRAALAMGTSLEGLVRRMPAPQPPTVCWTEFDRIRLFAPETIWTASPDARWRFARHMDTRHFVPRRSVFEPATEGMRSWTTHNTVREMFLEGRHYRSTPQYERMVRGVEQSSRKDSRGCRSVEEVDRYFERLVTAFESMRRLGYLTQEEQGRRVRDEIPLYMTAEGSLLKLGGANHRILLAEILGIRWLPFVLRGVHPEWLLRVSRELSLPPHRAYLEWLDRSPLFHGRRPEAAAAVGAS